jgi:hypothetical protein
VLQLNINGRMNQASCDGQRLIADLTAEGCISHLSTTVELSRGYLYMFTLYVTLILHGAVYAVLSVGYCCRIRTRGGLGREILGAFASIPGLACKSVREHDVRTEHLRLYNVNNSSDHNVIDPKFAHTQSLRTKSDFTFVRCRR